MTTHRLPAALTGLADPLRHPATWLGENLHRITAATTAILAATILTVSPRPLNLWFIYGPWNQALGGILIAACAWTLARPLDLRARAAMGTFTFVWFGLRGIDLSSQYAPNGQRLWSGLAHSAAIAIYVIVIVIGGIRRLGYEARMRAIEEERRADPNRPDRP